ncbi:hypothetical protein [Actinacidiphila soli]|uniref:hypothetical protein n=1 Tax=Actinacidiphila soli TaxID=2487275 RepID=UPI000FCAAC81|nr:hypothetical protein [Actinacidiphila soli]
MNSTGYAWGTTDGGAWLTIPRSYHKAPVLTETAEQAQRPYPGADTLARVERYTHPAVTGSGRAFKILEIVQHG